MLGHFIGKWLAGSLQTDGSRAPMVTRHKRDEKGPFTSNAADGQLTVRLTNNIADLFRHFIDNEMSHLFWECDAYYKKYNASMGVF